jgi:hypothetical protein
VWKRAQAALLEEIRRGPSRQLAFMILAQHGVLEAFDVALSIPDSEQLASRIVLYLPYTGPNHPDAIRAWYTANRNRLVFLKKLGLYQLSDSRCTSARVIEAP